MRQPFTGDMTKTQYKKSLTGKTNYQRRIIRLMKLYPGTKTLKELRGKRITDADKSKVPYNLLSSPEQSLRTKAVKILNKLRQGFTFREASEEIELNLTDFKKHVGNAVTKRHGRLFAKPNDFIQRALPFYEKGKSTTIIVTNFRDASLVGTYMNDVKKAINERTTEPLQKYKGRFVIAASGRKRYFETNWDKLFDIKQSLEGVAVWEDLYSDD